MDVFSLYKHSTRKHILKCITTGFILWWTPPNASILVQKQQFWFMKFPSFHIVVCFCFERTIYGSLYLTCCAPRVFYLRLLTFLLYFLSTPNIFLHFSDPSKLSVFFLGLFLHFFELSNIHAFSWAKQTSRIFLSP